MTFELKTVIAGGFAIATVAASATWAIRQDRLGELERTVEAYEKSKEWDLPGTLTNIRDASALLNKQLIERQEVERLKKQNIDLAQKFEAKDKELVTSRSKLAEMQATLDKKEQYIKNLYPVDETFRLGEGE